MRASRFVFLWVALCAGCSSSGGNPSDAGLPPLTCDWLAGDNCWKSTVNLATSCLPAGTDFGTLDAANMVCTYPNGTTITFDTPLQLPIPADAPPPFKFTVTAGGQTCLRFDENNTGFTLTAGGQQVTLTLIDEPGVQVTCPGGTTYFAPNFFELLSCTGGTMGVPGTSWFSNIASITFDLKGTSTATQLVPIFDCRRAS
jgi:hypothetical protein